MGHSLGTHNIAVHVFISMIFCLFVVVYIFTGAMGGTFIVPYWGIWAKKA